MTAFDEVWIPTDEEIALMTDDEKHEVTELLNEIRRREDEVWTPQPRQELATKLAGRATEMLFGGARGGGKTEWLIRYALDQALNHPLNRIGLFRKVYPALERTLIPRSRAVYPKFGGVWNDNKHTWTFLNGSVIELGSLPHEKSVDDYRGAEYGLLGFEEMTEFSEKQLNLMLGSLRAPGPGIRPHMIGTTNPGGTGHRWVKRRWVKPKPEDYTGTASPISFEVWRPAPTPENPNPNTRVFVPATLTDNPILLARDPEYLDRIRALAGSDKAMLKAWEHGDWDAIDAVEGALWKQKDLDGGRVSADWFKYNVTVQHRVLAVDPSDGNEDGKGDAYGIAVVALGMDGIGYVERTEAWRAHPDMLAKKTVTLAANMGCDEIVVERNHGGKWLKALIQGKDRYASIRTVWASEGKQSRARPVAALFSLDEDLAESGLEYRMKMVGTEHEEFEEQATTFTAAPSEPSPDVMDAVVWGGTYLLLAPKTGEGGEYEDDRLRGRR